MKTCGHCKQEKDLSEFAKNRSRPDGLQFDCRTCRKTYDMYHPRRQRAQSIRYDRNRRYVFEYLKEHSCMDCGESDPVVLDFDHLRDKVRSVSQMMNTSIEKLVTEMEKCEVVCSNCHRRRTAKRAGSFRLVNS